MDNDAFIKAYNYNGRNGSENFYRHSLSRKFIYSDGVQECAEAGCYWLLDIVATEALKPLRIAGPYEQGIIEVVVADRKADISMTIADDAPSIWSKHVEYTDMPEGTWKFVMKDEGEQFVMILLSEY
jgi:hypothetical protein